MSNLLRLCIAFGLAVMLGACGQGRSLTQTTYDPNVVGGNPSELAGDPDTANRDTIWSLFGANARQEVTVRVNKYLWAASLDTLSFLPIETVDPFTGVIVTGYGTPPGGSRAYRATVHVNDPSLSPRSLNVSLRTRSGPAAPATTRAVEDAILQRARQLRIADDKL